ncbi:MAG: hypothetical protein LIO77_10415 [Rikenellaceae bacterium]|nr:hypothetical protein [Rikenellaceae bacterium]
MTECIKIGFPITVSVVSLVLSILAFRKNIIFNSSDYKLTEKIKDDTLDLLATLMVRQLKGFEPMAGVTREW